MLKIYDDFLDSDTFDLLHSFFLRAPWFYLPSISGSETDLDSFLFTHSFFNISNPFDKRPQNPCILKPLLSKLSPQHLLRVKANLQPKSNSITPCNFHTDFLLNQLTAILYLNSNNGYTLFKDGTQVDSVKNRLCLFDGHLEHAGTTCTNAKYRMTLNINYIPVINRGEPQLPL